MNEIQEHIKALMEKKIKEQYDINLVVEYVSDVSERTHELQQKYEEKLDSVYDAEHVTGTFIPAVDNRPYYILIQKDREVMLDIMTAFHEYTHLLDYILFLRSVFNNNIELLKNSPLYITFNVYSEYNATLYGTKQYINIAKLEDMSQKELAELILRETKEKYRDLRGINNKYQLLIHSMQYVGNIKACSEFINDIGVQEFIDGMELSDQLYPTISHIFKFENKHEWYKDLDRIMREFVDGGNGS